MFAPSSQQSGMWNQSERVNKPENKPEQQDLLEGNISCFLFRCSRTGLHPKTCQLSPASVVCHHSAQINSTLPSVTRAHHNSAAARLQQRKIIPFPPERLCSFPSAAGLHSLMDDLCYCLAGTLQVILILYIHLTVPQHK